jgi:MFS family permease
MGPPVTTPATRPAVVQLSPAPPRTSSRPWRLETFRALRHRNYRLYFIGQWISLTGSWLQSAALAWLAYELTGQSRWPALVGAAGILPTLVLGVWGGGLADRWPKRQLIFCCQAALLVLALVLAGVVACGAATPWNLLAIALCCGVVNAVDLPARQSFVIDMVGRDDLLNAVALNSLLFNVARIVGPALTAVVLPGLGAALCFFLNGLSFVAVLAALAAMRLPAAARVGAVNRPEAGGTLRSTLAYLAGRPDLLLLMVLSGAVSFFGWPILPLLPAAADQLLGGGTKTYSWLLSALGCGAVVAALLIASFGRRVRRVWFLGAGLILAECGISTLGQCRQLIPALACSTLAGAGLILFFATSQAVLQLGSADNNRGRVLGIWSMLLGGAQPLGQLLAGVAADHWGVPLVLAAGGFGIAVSSLLVGTLWGAYRSTRMARPSLARSYCSSVANSPRLRR